MNFYYLSDRTTAKIYAIGIYSGREGWEEVTHTSQPEPILFDSINHSYWKLYVNNARLGLEETSVVGNEQIVLEDVVNAGTFWLLVSNAGRLGAQTTTEPIIVVEIPLGGGGLRLRKRRKYQEHKEEKKFICDIQGKVYFKEQLQYLVIGITCVIQTLSYNILGIVKYIAKCIKDVIARTKVLVQNTINVSSITQFSSSKKHIISGITKSLCVSNIDLVGKNYFKESWFSTVRGVQQQKQIFTSNLKGKFKLEIHNGINIKGERDITNILMSVGLLDSKIE